MSEAAYDQMKGSASQVNQQLAEMHENLDALSDRLELLEQRLGPVLREEVTGSDVVMTEIVGPKVALAAEMASDNERVNALRGRVSSMIERLEL